MHIQLTPVSFDSLVYDRLVRGHLVHTARGGAAKLFSPADGACSAVPFHHGEHYAVARPAASSFWHDRRAVLAALAAPHQHRSAGDGRMAGVAASL